MATYKTQATIIKRKNFGEADRLMTLYTERNGKVKAIAKGVRRSKAKMVGHMELFYLVDLQMAEGKNLDIVTSAEIINEFAQIRNNQQLTNQAYFMSELVDGLTHENEPHQEVFDLLISSLMHLNQKKDASIISFFVFKLLAFLGHEPQLFQCVKCHSKLSENNYFSNHLGGVLCEDCYKADLGSFRITVLAIKSLRLFSQNEIAILDKLKIDDKIKKEVGQLVINFAQYILEKPIKSLRFLK